MMEMVETEDPILCELKKDRNEQGLPPGFRFHPTDEELIMYYLRNQSMSRPCPVAIIPEVDIYKFDPWQLPGKKYKNSLFWVP